MLGIPVSFMLGIALFHLGFGYGISIIALIGFIMAIGIVVDDAIVVGEDAVTHFEQGKSPMDAAVAGARRMWVPVLTSSLTTMAALSVHNRSETASSIGEGCAIREDNDVIARACANDGVLRRFKDIEYVVLVSSK